MYFTQCSACGDTLQVTYTGQESHPACPQTEAEKLARQFVDAIQRGDQGEAERLEKLVNKIDEPPAPGSAALWYATVARWPVLPLRPDTKLPATRHGLNDATTDEGQIREWWSVANYNIGIRTGVLFDCIDVDGPTGLQSLAELGDGVLPDIHGKVGTPRGIHLLTQVSGDGNRAGVRPGIDYRGQGGYCVAPPSVVDGKRYTWLVRPSPEILGAAVPA